MNIQQQLKQACDLLTEVRQWHSDPQSPDYNECDTDPCAWCVLAQELIDEEKMRKEQQ